MEATSNIGAVAASSGGPGEREIVLAARTGDRDALGKLLHGYADGLRARLSGQIGRTHRSAIDAADVIQVTFIEAFLRINQFRDRGEGSFFAWLTQAAENNLRDAVRALNRQKRRAQQPAREDYRGDDSWMALAAAVARSSSTPSRKLSLMEAKEFLRDAIPKLPPLYQEVIELYHLAGLPAEEVGRLIGGKSQAAVFMLSARAREHLADLLGGWSRFFSSRG